MQKDWAPRDAGVDHRRIGCGNYLQREGRELRPTAKAFSLITLLRGLKVPELTSPELTGDWEFKLRQIEQGKLKRNKFMEEIAGMTGHIVEQAKRIEAKQSAVTFPR